LPGPLEVDPPHLPRSRPRREQKEKPWARSGARRPRVDVLATTTATAERGAPCAGTESPGPGAGRGRGGGAGLHVEAKPHAVRAPRRPLPAAGPSFHLGSLGLRTRSSNSEGRAGAGQRAGSGGLVSQRVQAKQSGGICKWQAELGFPPRRDRVGAEAKGRSGAQQGTSCSYP
jgi:hypothetical protein